MKGQKPLREIFFVGDCVPQNAHAQYAIVVGHPLKILSDGEMRALYRWDDWSTGGFGHAVNELTWPVSEAWSD
ncbi:MAG: hypothetical protein LBE06_11175 [Azoarcus sp.]|jgi:hypothetical protein|nr:hypothetical protein [Azoarcus sp.]